MIVPQVFGVLIYIYIYTVSTYQKLRTKIHPNHPIKIIPGGRLIIIQFPSLEASAAREEAAAELWMVREEEQVAVKEAADAVPWTDFGKRRGGVEDWRWQGEDFFLISGAKGGAKEVPVRQMRFCCHPRTEMSEAAEARLEASAAPAIAWARAEEEVLQELERLQMEQRRWLCDLTTFLGGISKVWSFSCSEVAWGLESIEY